MTQNTNTFPCLPGTGWNSVKLKSLTQASEFFFCSRFSLWILGFCWGTYSCSLWSILFPMNLPVYHSLRFPYYLLSYEYDLTNFSCMLFTWCVFSHPGTESLYFLCVSCTSCDRKYLGLDLIISVFLFGVVNVFIFNVIFYIVGCELTIFYLPFLSMEIWKY